jgi:hypothetical protein
MRDPLSRAEHCRKLAVKYRELAKFAQPAYLGDFYRGIAVRYAFMAQEASERANKDGFTPERRARPEPSGAQGQTEDVSIDVRKRREKVGGGGACTREVRIGLGSTSAIMGALAFGFTLGLMVKYGLADAGPRRVPAHLSDLETASSTSSNLQRRYGSQVPRTPGMRLASLEMSVSDFLAEDNDPPALARPPVFLARVCSLTGAWILLTSVLGASRPTPPQPQPVRGSRRTLQVSHRWICLRKQRATLQAAGLRRSRPLHQRSLAPRNNGFARQIFRRI